MEKINWMKYQDTRDQVPTLPFLAGWASHPNLSVPPPTYYISSFQKHCGSVIKRKEERNYSHMKTQYSKCFRLMTKSSLGWFDWQSSLCLLWASFTFSILCLRDSCEWWLGEALGRRISNSWSYKNNKLQKEKKSNNKPLRQRHPLFTLFKQAPTISPQWSIPFEDIR